MASRGGLLIAECGEISGAVAEFEDQGDLGHGLDLRADDVGGHVEQFGSGFVGVPSGAGSREARTGDGASTGGRCDFLNSRGGGWSSRTFRGEESLAKFSVPLGQRGPVGEDLDGVDLARDEQLRLAMTVTVSPS